MGGELKVIIKKEEEFKIQIAWTNGMPSIIKNDKFIEGDDKYINNFFIGNNEPFSPVQYGIDIFDFDKKLIINSQGYCNYREIDHTTISLYLGGVYFDGIDKEDENYFPTVFRRMYDNGMLTTCNRIWGDERITFEPIDDFKIEWYLKNIDKIRYKKKFSRLTFRINWEKYGWEIVDNLDEGGIETLKYVYNLYDISDSDLKTWGEEILYHCDDDVADEIKKEMKKLKVMKRKRKLENLKT
jgi:hypothetical protein